MTCWLDVQDKLGLAMAQAVSRRPLNTVHVGFEVDSVAVGQVFSKFFGLTLPLSFHHGSPYSYITWGMNNSTVGGCSSQT
jgi:hypothetical protein